MTKRKRTPKAVVHPSGSYQASPRTEIILKLVQEFQDRARKDIDKWRQAITAAENPEDHRWFIFQDLIDELEIDGHFGSVAEIRFSSTLNHPFYVIDRKTGETLDEQTNLLQEEWFFNFMAEALLSIQKKYSLMQFYKEADKINFWIIPHRNVCPQKKRVYTEVAGDHFIDYTMLPDVIEIQHRSKFGIMNDIIPNLIWKRNLMQSNAEFSEKYGMPLITATTANKADVTRIDQALKNLGEAGTGVLPKGSEITVHPLANAGNPEKVYLDPAKFHDQQISKRFLGSTTITDEGANRAQTEVHASTLDDVLAQKDRRMIMFAINNKLFPLLQRFGLPFDNTKMSFKFDDNESLTLEQEWKITSEAMHYYELDEREVAKRFNLPIIGKRMGLPIFQSATSQQPDNSFNSATLMQAMAVACNINLPDYTDFNHFKVPNNVTNKTSNLQKELAEFDAQINHHLYNKDITEAQRNRLLKAKRIAEKLRSSLFSGWGNRRIETDWNAPDHRSLAAMEMNLFRFAESKSLAEVQMLNQLLIDKEKHQIRSEEDFLKVAKKINENLNENYLRTERDFAIATGQNSARYYEFLAEKVDIPYWQYQTVGDEHVRHTHRILDGKIFAWDDVEGRRLYPPNDYGCRCEAVQYPHRTNKIESGKDWINAIFPTEKLQKNFAVNRADAGVVFTQNQMYINQLTGKNKTLNQYTFSDYGLQKWDEFKNTLKELKLDQTITETNIKELFKNNAGTDTYKAMGFEDYLKRKIILKEKTFNTHTKGKYIKETENRHQLFSKIKEVLESPSEVWLNKYEQTRKTQLRYIKFYQNNIIVVDGEINNDLYELKTWYWAKDKEEMVRSGLVIK